jgi:hypothetical protein
MPRRLNPGTVMLLLFRPFKLGDSIEVGARTARSRT